MYALGVLVSPMMFRTFLLLRLTSLLGAYRQLSGQDANFAQLPYFQRMGN